MNNLKLVHMGRNFLIEKKSEREDIIECKNMKKDIDSGYIFKEIHDLEYFDEIIYSKNMIKHHFPHRYEEGLFSADIILIEN